MKRIVLLFALLTARMPAPPIENDPDPQSDYILTDPGDDDQDPQSGADDDYDPDEENEP